MLSVKDHPTPHETNERKWKAKKRGLKKISLRLAVLIHKDYPEVRNSYGEWICPSCRQRWHGAVSRIEEESSSENDDDDKDEYVPPPAEQSEEQEDVRNEKRESLKKFLRLSGFKKTLWSTPNYRNLSRHARKNYLSHCRAVIKSVFSFLAPNDTDTVICDLFHSANDPANCVLDDKFISIMEGVAEAYNKGENWTIRREILSVVATKINYQLLQSFIPGITIYRFSAARRHAFEFEHFIDFILSPHICTDMPFGEQSLKLSNGTELFVPNTIRNLIPCRIVDQYYSYILENSPGFPPLGRTSLLTLLNVCKASTRHGLQDVNYFAVNGGQAFDDLIQLVAELGLDIGSKRSIIDNLKRARMYLKSDYKVHVGKSSTVADHCANYALSFSKDKDYEQQCDHSHHDTCDECQNLATTFDRIGDKINHTVDDEDLLDRALARWKMACEAIDSWKCHQCS
ncbi:unnamed protein product [Didymodactylos carnosus]|uniref:Uncharacterized protein n=1 Tax=Didymodactylos carnosus TaxID=1234261 RepID=A0A8S2QP07_9BILA|nr:unnamed protein product [Didymodactylos carnosus]